MENKNKYPAIPTYLNFDINRTNSIKEGWYATRINSKGIEVLPITAICFGKNTDEDENSFNKCMQACNIHNEFIGMSKKEISILYAQRRFDIKNL